MPLLGSLALPFAAVPVVRLTHRAGWRSGLLASSIAAALLFGLVLAASTPRQALLGAVFATIVTAAPAGFAERVRRVGDPSAAYLALCVAGFILLAGGLLARSLVGSATMPEEISSAFEQMSPAALQAYSRGELDAETVARMNATVAAAREFARVYWIGLVGVFWVLAAAISFYAGARFARPEPSAELARFDALRLPAAAVALFVVAGAGSVLLPSAWRPVAGNALLPLLALYFVLGLSIICHFARRWFRARILRVAVYTLVVYFPMNVAVALLGLFDWYADFRRRGEGAIEKT